MSRNKLLRGVVSGALIRILEDASKVMRYFLGLNQGGTTEISVLVFPMFMGGQDGFCFMGGSKKIIIVKIGSSVIMTRRGRLDEFRILHIADQIVGLKEKGYSVVLIVSGAVAFGANFIHISDGKLLRQGAAGIGQVYLISKLHELFGKKNIVTAQILLTRDNVERKGKENIYNLLNFYLENNILPILNENDVVKLNNFGGNDFLALEVAKLIDASQVILLSSWEKSKFGVGGGGSKEEVLRQLLKMHIMTKIIDGKVKNIILREIL